MPIIMTICGCGKMEELIKHSTVLPVEEILLDLEDCIEDKVNSLGIDSMIGIPDYIIAEWMVQNLKTLILTKQSIEKHEQDEMNG